VGVAIFVIFVIFCPLTKSGSNGLKRNSFFSFLQATPLKFKSVSAKHECVCEYETPVIVLSLIVNHPMNLMEKKVRE
jgi:hypothetical protein